MYIGISPHPTYMRTLWQLLLLFVVDIEQLIIAQCSQYNNQILTRKPYKRRKSANQLAKNMKRQINYCKEYQILENALNNYKIKFIYHDLQLALYLIFLEF